MTKSELKELAKIAEEETEIFAEVLLIESNTATISFNQLCRIVERINH